MSFKTTSAILRGHWLLEKSWAQSHLPLVAALIKGNNADFGFKEKQENTGFTEVLSNKKSSGVYKVGYYTDLQNMPDGSIAMITIAGPVLKYGDWCSYGTIDYAATINKIANAANISGILLNIDSPGGEAYGTQLLVSAIKDAAAKKSVVAVIDDGIAASAAMWIASAATEIYVTRTTDMVGSVGVYTTIADWYAYFEAEGLKVRDIYAPQSEEKNLDYKEALSGKDDLIKAELKVLCDAFINDVQTNRSATLTSDEWKKGKMFYAKDAMKIGLINGIKTFQQVIDRMGAMIKENSNNSNTKSNNMAFEKTLSAFKATELKVVEGGFLVEEDHLNNCEALLAKNETDASALQTQATEANTAKETAESNLVIANTAKETAETNLATATAKITELEGEVAELKKGDGSKFTNPEGEDKGGKVVKNEFETSYDREAAAYNNSFTEA